MTKHSCHSVTCGQCGRTFQRRNDSTKVGTGCGIGNNCKLPTSISQRLRTIHEGIIQRCTNSKNKSYKNYGGRGLVVEDDWKDIYWFWKDMEEPPLGTEIDRINNSKGYVRGNCRWVTRDINNRNHRRNVMVYVGDREMCMTDACKVLRIDRKRVYHLRATRKWSIEDAIVYCVNNTRTRRRNLDV